MAARYGDDLVLPIDWTTCLTELTSLSKYYRPSIPLNPKPNSKPYEAMDNVQTKCVSFSTSKERLCGWLYTLDLRYHQQLGESEHYNVDWTDNFQEGSATSYANTKISISRKIDGKMEKILTITVYFNTLTLFIQGNTVETFANKEFQLLKTGVDLIFET